MPPDLDPPPGPLPADMSAAELEQVLAAAHRAAAALAGWAPGDRARLLRAMADAVDGAADRLLPVAMAESHLPEGRLRGEVARSSGQLRMFAAAIEEGSLLEVVIDPPDPGAVPVPRPALRRMLVPLGPVLVFAASNFPFAFSVAGGDTAAAVAAGCSVVVKGHPGHPRLSLLTAEVLASAAESVGAPQGTIGVVLGTRAGVEALRDSRISAAAFTGSVRGGVALHQVAASRPDPIPFYGELGSLNPVVVREGAAQTRPRELAEGYVASFTLGIGQFCTKPGLLLLPRGHAMDRQLESAGQAARGGQMLTETIHDAFTGGLERLRSVDGVRTIATSNHGEGAAPAMIGLDVAILLAHREVLLEECFGPVSLVVEYADDGELLAALDAVGGTLTATVHAEDDEIASLQPVLDRLTAIAGRVVWNGWPTGVAVAWGMQHGGPFPATVGSVHSSVGATAVRRFQRPVCFQDVPDAALPVALRDENVFGIVRRIDGRITDGPVPSR